MIRSCINICLLAVISLLFGVIWQGPAHAAAPAMVDLGQIADTFNTVATLDVDSTGNLYATDVSDRAVYKYNQYGNRIATFSVNSAAGYLKGAGFAVAADGRMYVGAAAGPSDAFADRVIILDAAGNQVGLLGQGAGEFQSAGTLDIDVNGNVYVVDQLARNIKVYAPGSSTGAVFGGLSYSGSISLAVDQAANQIYVANYVIDTSVPTLYVYDAAGVQLQAILAETGFGAVPIARFGGIAFDNATPVSRFYVSDYSLSTIRVMDKPATPVASYATAIDQAPSMVFDPVTSRLFVNHANAKIDIIGIDGGITPVKANDAPTVPVPVTVGEVGSLTPALAFNNSTDSDGDTLTYNLRVLAGTTTVASFSVAEAVSPTAATVNVALIENSSYTWQVQADDGLLTSAWSAAQSIYVNAVQSAPGAPFLTAFVSGEAAGSDAILSWTASFDPDPNSSVSYRVEISDTSVVASTTTTATSVALAGLAANLAPGTAYSWQVTAVDNTALETVSLNNGNFVYQDSVLEITSNVPGATVSLGGHHGYAGRMVGTAPVVIRGLAAGDYSVVVEAAGFGPVVATVTVVKDMQTDFLAELKGARLAVSFATHNLNVAVSGADATPVVADLDRDGILDLVLADNGFINVYKGSKAIDPLAADTIEDLSASTVATERLVFAAAAVQLAIPQISGAAPCLVDWNNDDNLDLLVGGADGSVKLFLGMGGLNFPTAATETLINVSGQAIPTVADVDGDGAKDLVIATPTELLLITNVGSDSAPMLGSQTLMTTLTAPATPLFNDWDADGSRDLLLLSQGELFKAEVVAGVVTTQTSTGLTVAGANRVFALNFAGSSYTDLVFATSTGALVVANGQQGDFAPAYKAALLAKLADVETAVLNQAPELIGQVANIASRIGRGRYASATIKAEQLAANLAVSSPAEVVVGELVGLLN